MKKIARIMLLLLSLHKTISAQDLEPIQTDRPDQTECPFIVPVKYLQVENGFGYLHNDKMNRSYTYPSILIKYGITENFDLRLITGIINSRSGNEKFTGFPPLTAGFKVKILKEKGIIPLTSFIGHLTFPTIASEKYKLTYYAPSFRFTMQHTLSKNISLGYNLGAAWDGETPEPIFLYTLTVGIALSKKFGSYVELYGFAPQYQTAQHSIDAGLTCFVNKDILLDISGGYRLTQNAPDYFAALGFSFRVNTQKDK